MCTYVSVPVSVAVFMACQDVEVAVGCRVVRRPAFQHHHPATQNTHGYKTRTHTTSSLVSSQGSKTIHPFPDERRAQLDFQRVKKTQNKKKTGTWSKLVKTLLFGKRQ